MADDRYLTDCRASWEKSYALWEQSAHNLWRAAHTVRSGEGPIILFVGDSIARGYSDDTFAFDPNNPLSMFRHPDRLFNQLAIGNGSPWRACFSGLMNMDHAEKAFKLALRPGDVILYQDWGPRAPSYASTFHQFAYFASRTKELVDNQVVFLDGFSTSEAGPIYDFNAPCEDSDKTPNQAIRAASEAFGVQFLPVSSRLAVAEQIIKERFRFSLFQADGVHPNGIGNLLLVAILMSQISGSVPLLAPVCPHVSELFSSSALDIDPVLILACLQKLL